MLSPPGHTDLPHPPAAGDAEDAGEADGEAAGEADGEAPGEAVWLVVSGTVSCGVGVGAAGPGVASGDDSSCLTGWVGGPGEGSKIVERVVDNTTAKNAVPSRITGESATARR